MYVWLIEAGICSYGAFKKGQAYKMETVPPEVLAEWEKTGAVKKVKAASIKTEEK